MQITQAISKEGGKGRRDAKRILFYTRLHTKVQCYIYIVNNTGLTIHVNMYAVCMLVKTSLHSLTYLKYLNTSINTPITPPTKDNSKSITGDYAITTRNLLTHVAVIITSHSEDKNSAETCIHNDYANCTQRCRDSAFCQENIFITLWGLS